MQGLALTTTNKPLACTILRHTTPSGTHYDWLFQAPRKPPESRLKQSVPAGAPSERTLWTARLPLPPHDWPHHGTLPLVRLPPHRHRYLHYQGPLTDHRGKVQRVDRGWLILQHANPAGFGAAIQLRGFVGIVRVDWTMRPNPAPTKAVSGLGLARFQVKSVACPRQGVSL